MSVPIAYAIFCFSRTILLLLVSGIIYCFLANSWFHIFYTSPTLEISLSSLNFSRQVQTQIFTIFCSVQVHHIWNTIKFVTPESMMLHVSVCITRQSQFPVRHVDKFLPGWAIHHVRRTSHSPPQPCPIAPSLMRRRSSTGKYLQLDWCVFFCAVVNLLYCYSTTSVYWSASMLRAVLKTNVILRYILLDFIKIRSLPSLLKCTFFSLFYRLISTFSNCESLRIINRKWYLRIQFLVTVLCTSRKRVAKQGMTNRSITAPST